MGARRAWLATGGVAVAVGLLFLLVSGARPTCAQEEDSELSVVEERPACSEGPAHADLDGDKLYEDLEARLWWQPWFWTSEVIVTLGVEPTEAKMAELERAVGPFTVTSNKENVTDAEGSPWVDLRAFGAEMQRAQIEGLARRGDVESVSPDLVGSFAA